MEIISGKPYIDESGKAHHRIFNVDAPDEEYVWHKDKNDREVEIVEGEGWQLQIEDCLPMLLNNVKKVFIPKGVYHRLIKGYNTLKVKINEIT